MPAAGPGWNVSRAFFPSGDAPSSAILVNQVLPGTVRVGQNYNYEIHVTNITGGTLQNVVVSNKNLSNLSVVSAVPASTSAADGGYMWNLGELGSCKTAVIKVTGKADKIGMSTNCIVVAYNNALCAGVNVVEPKIALVKTITPESILNCTPIEMTLKVTNPGSGVAENIVVKDTLPAGLMTADGKQVLEMAMGNLGPGESKTQAVALKASKTGKFDNMASVTAAGGLTANSNTVSTVVKQPVLEITCKASAESVRLGQNTKFDFTVANKGDTACSTTVSAPIPSGATFVSASDGGMLQGGSVVWNIGNLAAGAPKTVSVTVKPATIAAVALTATASCQCAAPVSTSCSTSVQGTADIGTLVTDDNVDVVAVGENQPYRVEVKNQGQINLTNTKMVVTLPEGLTFVSSATGTAVGNKVTFNFGTLAPGKVAAGSFIARATKSGELLLIGETTCTELKTPIRDDELTNFVDK